MPSGRRDSPINGVGQIGKCSTKERSLLRLPKQDVRPHLELPTHARSPWTMADKECLKKVQMRAMSMLLDLTSIEMKKSATRQMSI